MTADATPNSPAAPQGGTGGLVPARPGRGEGSGDVRRNRLKRIVDAANLKAARKDAVGKALTRLVDGIADGPSPREKRLNAEAVLKHFRDTVRAEDAGDGDDAGRLVIHIHPPPAAPPKDTPAQAVVITKAETNGHAGNGHTNGSTNGHAA